jgi:hypothetical protein
MTEAGGRCAICEREAVARCDQCGDPLCEAHRTTIATELGTWTRCRRCARRNRIRNSPIVSWMYTFCEIDFFFRWVWMLAVGVVLVLLVVYRLVVGK